MVRRTLAESSDDTVSELLTQRKSAAWLERVVTLPDRDPPRLYRLLQDTLLFDEDESDDDRRDTQRKAADITPPRSKCGGPGYCQKSFCFSCSLAQADDSSGEG